MLAIFDGKNGKAFLANKCTILGFELFAVQNQSFFSLSKPFSIFIAYIFIYLFFKLKSKKNLF